MRAARPALLAAACLTTACLTGVAGCAPRAAPTPGFGPWPPASAPATVTILSGSDTSVSAGNEPMRSGEGMYGELVDWWNANEQRATHIHVVLDTVPGGATAEHSEMLADAQAGGAGYDIYNLDSEWVPEFAAAGYIRSLDGRLSGGFLAQPLASGQYAGHQYAAPFTTDVGLLYYRKDLVSPSLVKDLGSFPALVRLAETTMAAHPELAIGYAGQFASYEGLTVNLLEIMHSDYPQAFAPNGTVRDSSALTFGLQSLYDTMHLSPVLPSFELSYTEAQAFTQFATGKALFMRNWPIYYDLLATSGLPTEVTVKNQVGVATLPFPSVLGGQDLAISTGSKDPGAALQVVNYLTSAEAERCLFGVGGFPATRTSAYQRNTKPALPAGYGGIARPLCGTQPGPSLDIAPQILSALNTAFQRPRTPYYTEFSALIQQEVPLFLGPSGNSLGDIVSALVAGLRDASSGRPPPAPPASPAP